MTDRPAELPHVRVRFLVDVSYGGVDYGPSHPEQVARVRDDWAEYFVREGKALRLREISQKAERA